MKQVPATGKLLKKLRKLRDRGAAFGINITSDGGPFIQNDQAFTRTQVVSVTVFQCFSVCIPVNLVNKEDNPNISVSNTVLW